MNLLYDLGAHWGESAKFFESKIKSPEDWDVICVEASPKNFERLQSNIGSKVGKKFNDVKCVCGFVYHEDRDIDFYEFDDPNMSVSCTFSKKKADYNMKVDYAKRSNKKVSIIKPEVFNICESYLENIKKYDRVDIKMDIEGAEYDLLPELIKIIDPTKTRNFFIEFHHMKMGLPSSVNQPYIKFFKDNKINSKELNNCYRI